MRYHARKQMTRFRLQIYKSWTRPEVRARARASVAQVEIEHASCRTVVPVAATEGLSLNSQVEVETIAIECCSCINMWK